MKIRMFSILLAIIMIFSLVACGNKTEPSVSSDTVADTEIETETETETEIPESDTDILSTGEISVERDEENGGIIIKIPDEDFLSLGFEFGDSVDVEFSCDIKLEDIPFLNGYTRNLGGALLVVDTQHPYITAKIDNGDYGIDLLELDEDCTAKVILREKGKYVKLSDILQLEYSYVREDFADDESFANFRAINCGDLRENTFYRSASPCDNSYSRAEYASDLCKKYGIGFIIDLADDGAEGDRFFEDDDLNVPYWKNLYENGGVMLFDISGYYGGEAYAMSVAEVMRAIIANDGPYLIHCTEGKERTGFVCALLEILSGASIEDITADYMKSYENYYGITEVNDKETYDAVVNIVFDDMLCTIAGVNNASMVTEENLASGALNYLRYGYLSDDEIRELVIKIKKQ